MSPKGETNKDKIEMKRNNFFNGHQIPFVDAQTEL